MRIQYLFDRPLPAHETDSEQVVQTVAALARCGHDVELVVPETEAARVDADALRDHYRVRGAFRVRGVMVDGARNHSVRKLAFAELVSTLYTRADIRYTRNLPVLFTLARASWPFAYETYRPWFDQFAPLGPPIRRALQAPSALGAVMHSHYAAGRYTALGVADSKLLVAHNGHDPVLSSAVSDRVTARRALGIPETAQVVTYTGHVNMTKGIDSIVSLARRLPHVTFQIVGWDGKIGLASLLAQRVHNVEVIRWQPFERIAWYLAAADVLLLPPTARGFQLVGNTVLPIKLFQYLAAGRPILAPATADTAELLVDGNNARLVPEGDIATAATALHELLSGPGVCEQLAAGARATATSLTWDARAEKLSRFLEQRLSLH